MRDHHPIINALTETIKVAFRFNFILLALLISNTWVSNGWAAESVLWQQFKNAKLSGGEPVLPDFSYAGYDYSETDIPDTSNWPVFNVTDYGAVADDGNYDDAAIQSTINAAALNGGGIVFFPTGRFMISPNETVGENIFINNSNILLTDVTQLAFASVARL